MAPDHTSGERLVAWASGREQRKGLRPRDAAILIIIVWFLAIAVFGIVEHLVEPKAFPTVWLGMWWALVTVTTVGYWGCRAGKYCRPDHRVVSAPGRTGVSHGDHRLITGGFVARYQRETSVRPAPRARITSAKGWSNSAWSSRNCAPKSRNCAPKSRACAPLGNGSDAGSRRARDE